MPGTFEQGSKLMQPQLPGGPPRAASPGMGAGPRAYAPGATQAFQGQQKPDPMAYGAPGVPDAGTPVQQTPTPDPHTGQASPNPMAQMQMAQGFAQRLVQLLMQKNQMRTSG